LRSCSSSLRIMVTTLFVADRHSQSPPNTNKGFSKRWGTVERDDVVNSAIGTLDFRVQVQ
jgi:hypothetical protein